MSVIQSLNRTAMVTGASSGIGLAAVKQFLAAGYRVVAHIRSEPRKLQPLLSNPNLELIKADFASGEAIKNVTQESILGEIDILVNNAGTYYYRDDFESLAINEVQNIMQVILLHLLY